MIRQTSSGKAIENDKMEEENEEEEEKEEEGEEKEEEEEEEEEEGEALSITTAVDLWSKKVVLWVVYSVRHLHLSTTYGSHSKTATIAAVISKHQIKIVSECR